MLEGTSDHLKFTALHLAAYKGLDNMVNLLLWNGAEANIMAIKRFLQLHCGIAKNKVECLEIFYPISCVLIKASNEVRCMSLFIAASSDAGDCMRFLIRNGILVYISDSNNCTALVVSVSFGSKNTTQNGAFVNAQTF